MPKINILPKSLACLIAAGEVVERPSSVVKELMENSIDAGATKITVEIKNGGVRYIRITDNGCGISREDVRAAFISHATSKISVQEDLDAIFTLGFRGEALASVAAVAHIEMLTKTADDDIGTKYCISGGEEKELTEAGCPDGTTIMIRDLFYNTPARMKFLKKDMTEGGYVSDVVSKIALSHPEISITFIKDNRRTLFTPGDGRLMTVINEVYGKEFGATLIECEGGADGVTVKGYISKPVHSRPNRSMQHMFVNGRYVKLPVSASALDNAYKNSIMVGKYPSCVLFLEINPSLVDVNVHPAKTQVRFASEKPVYDAIYFSAVSSLQKGDTPVQITAQPRSNDRLFTPKTEIHQTEMPVQTQKVSLRVDVKTKEEKVLPPVENLYKGIKSEFKPQFLNPQPTVVREDKKTVFSFEDEEDVLSMCTPQPVAEEKTEPGKTFTQQEMVHVSEEKAEPEIYTAPVGEEAEREEVIEKPVPEFRVLGEAFSTYILVQMKNELLFVDKHAAHERIIFNQLKKQGRKIHSQILMLPVTVTLSVKEYEAVLDNLDLFSQSGFAVDDFGDGTVRVTECPTELADGDISSLVAEIADKLSKNSKDPEPKKLEWLYHSTACRAAVKAGDDITLTEMQELVKRVLTDDEVRYCPHGRPVMFSMSEYEIKKLFGRNG